MNRNQLVLVDQEDNALGVIDKMKAHEEGRLHRAFSILLYNSKGEMLIHKRAEGKYHCGGLWTNACCSHPMPEELPIAAAHRRLQEEMGMKADLNFCFSFIYKAPFDNGLTEHEYDHVFKGVTDAIPEPNPEEVADWKYISVEALKMDVKAFPENYTVWFRLILDELERITS